MNGVNGAHDEGAHDEGAHDEEVGAGRSLGAPDLRAGGSSLRVDDLQWQRAYDRVSIERFVVEVNTERARLEAEIDEARARLRRARQVRVERRSDRDSELGDLALGAQRRLAEMERNQRELIETIQATAENEARRVLEAARTEAARIGSAVTRLGSDR